MDAMPLPDSIQGLLTSTADDPGIPKLYCNGFVNAVGPGDITVLLLRNERPVAMLNMSHTVAKTMVTMIGRAVAQLESDAGIKVPTISEIAQQLGKGNEAE